MNPLISFSILLATTMSIGKSDRIEKISLVAKTNGAPPIVFNYDTTGIAVFVRHLEKEVPPETVFAHPNDHQLYLKFRYGKLLMDTFQVEKWKIDSIKKRILNSESKTLNLKINKNLPGVYLEVKSKVRKKTYLFSLKSDSLLVSNAICTLFTDSIKDSPESLLPYFRENFSLHCK